jgi:hypothetical protein
MKKTIITLWGNLRSMIQTHPSISGQNCSHLSLEIVKTPIVSKVHHLIMKTNNNSRVKNLEIRIKLGTFSNKYLENLLMKRTSKALSQKSWLQKNNLIDIVFITKWLRTGLKQKKDWDCWEVITGILIKKK